MVETGENITNAVRVLEETYQNLSKMFEVMTSEARTLGLKKLNTHPMRWNTDQNPWAWVRTSMVNIFVKDIEHPEVTDAPDNLVFVTDVLLGGNGKIETPSACIASSVFVYPTPNPTDFKSGLSDHWLYHHPVIGCAERFVVEALGDGLYKTTPKDAKQSASYQCVVGAVIRSTPLESLTGQASVQKLLKDLLALEDNALELFGVDASKRND